MTKFSNHFLMSYEDIKEYVVTQLELFPTTRHLEVTEIGDGNINYVFRVEELESGKSVIVKQADKLLRSSGRPLDLNRNKIEAEALMLQNQLVPEFVPKVYDYNDVMAALTMEDISSYHNLRYELKEQQIFPDLAEKMSTYLVDSLFPTTDLVCDKKEKKARVQQFINIDMCDISEDLVFTEPYNDYKKQNIILKENQTFVTENIYQNDCLIGEVAQLRNHFLNSSQSLIHGDLHTGSIFINQTGVKIIDPEFAFYGPMGYDIGNLIAHLFFPLTVTDYFEQELVFSQWLSETIQAVYDLVKEKLTKAYQSKVTLSLYQNDDFQKKYIQDILADSLGFAGTELIRRVIGDAKVLEITSAPVNKTRVEMERTLIQLGIELISQRKKITSGQEIIELFEDIKKVRK